MILTLFKKRWLYLLISALIISIIALTVHIHLQRYLAPLLSELSNGISAPNGPENYSTFIVTSAYVTAFLQTLVVFFLYYKTQHLIPTSHLMLRILILAFIFGTIAGNFRQLIMDYIVCFNSVETSAFYFAVMLHLDPLISIALKSTLIVILCPRP